jgi:hypothetical protein
LLEGDYRKIANSSEELNRLKEDPENLEIVVQGQLDGDLVSRVEECLGS